MKEFVGRVAVITGAASGLGKAFADTAARLGMKLVLADVQQAALDTVVSAFNAAGTRAVGMRTDVSSADDVQALADLAVAEFDRVHLVFNNAGVTTGGLVWENTQKDWDWVLGVNLQGVINGVRIFTPLMLAEAARDPSYEAHIVNTASMAGLLAGTANGVYSVSKHGVVALTECLHHDLSLVTDQVRCSALCPSYVSTAIGHSDRNRPRGLANDAPITKSQQVARDITQNSLAAGGPGAGDVSERTFEAIRDGRFYVFPHPTALASVKQRIDLLLAHRNPGDERETNPARQARRDKLLAAMSTPTP